jgi:hypothetical protein
MRIDRSDSADGPDDAQVVRSARSTPDDPGASGKDRGMAASGDCSPRSSPASSDTALRAEQFAAHCDKVNAAYRQYDIDCRRAPVERLERETVARAVRPIEVEDPKPQPVGPNDRLKVEGRLPEAADLMKVETLKASGGDIPDDPRNYSNPKTGRLDASWSAYDRAIAAARGHSGGDLGPDSIKNV